MRIPRQEGKFRIGLVGDREVRGKGVFVTAVNNAAAHDAGLAPGMRMLEIDGINVVDSTQQEVLSALLQAGETVSLKVGHDPEGFEHFKKATGGLVGDSMLTARDAHDVSGDPGPVLKQSHTNQRTVLVHRESGGYGLKLAASSASPGPIFVAGLTPDGPTAQTLQVHEGDQIVAINGIVTTHIREGMSCGGRRPARMHAALVCVREKDRARASVCVCVRVCTTVMGRSGVRQRRGGHGVDSRPPRFRRADIGAERFRMAPLAPLPEAPIRSTDLRFQPACVLGKLVCG
jgi:hypothetical protein